MRRLNPHRDYLQIMSSVYMFWNVKGEFPICLLLADWSILAKRSKRHLNYIQVLDAASLKRVLPSS
jgi:hypothetical protein